MHWILIRPSPKDDEPVHRARVITPRIPMQLPCEQAKNTADVKNCLEISRQNMAPEGSRRVPAMPAAPAPRASKKTKSRLPRCRGSLSPRGFPRAPECCTPCVRSPPCRCICYVVAWMDLIMRHLDSGRAGYGCWGRGIWHDLAQNRVLEEDRCTLVGWLKNFITSSVVHKKAARY